LSFLGVLALLSPAWRVGLFSFAFLFFAFLFFLGAPTSYNQPRLESANLIA
jgi:hypothetical protein